MPTANTNTCARTAIINLLASTGLTAASMAAAVSIAIDGRADARLDWSMSEWSRTRGRRGAEHAIGAACPVRPLPSLDAVRAAIAWMRDENRRWASITDTPAWR